MVNQTIEQLLQEAIDQSMAQTQESRELAEEVSGKIGDIHEMMDAKMLEVDQKVDAALLASIKSLTYTESKLIGPGEEFETLNEALRYYITCAPSFYTSGTAHYTTGVILKIKSGTTISEQVLVGPGVDLGFIRIEAEDDKVYVDHTALVHRYESRYPLFGASRGGKLPQINALFEFLPDATEKQDGVLVSGVGSSCLIYASKGVRKAGGDGLRCENGAVISAASTIFSDAAFHGICAINSAIISASGAEVNNAGADGCHLEDCSLVDFSQGKANHVSGRGVYAYGESIIQAHSAALNDSGDIAAYIYASRANLIGASGERAKNYGLLAQMASSVNAHSSKWMKGDVEDSTDASIATGSIVNASGAFSGGTNVAKNTLTVSGIVFG
tara:strand:- start:4261 stop:5418 length:1158 start_codon:yes stop_codon:yes gene_type:complete